MRRSPCQRDMRPSLLATKHHYVDVPFKHIGIVTQHITARTLSPGYLEKYAFSLQNCIRRNAQHGMGSSWSRFRVIQYILIALWYEPSVCCLSVCLSSVTFVRPAHRVKLFVNIFATPETWTVCFKMFCKKS